MGMIDSTLIWSNMASFSPALHQSPKTQIQDGYPFSCSPPITTPESMGCAIPAYLTTVSIDAFNVFHGIEYLVSVSAEPWKKLLVLASRLSGTPDTFVFRKIIVPQGYICWAAEIVFSSGWEICISPLPPPPPKKKKKLKFGAVATPT